jgi:hypothetical protein
MKINGLIVGDLRYSGFSGTFFPSFLFTYFYFSNSQVCKETNRIKWAMIKWKLTDSLK